MDLYARPSVAQYGEDLIAGSYLSEVNNGFYVDIGAHHPVRLSNTHLLNRRGWKGINVDPNPAAIKIFNKKRPTDINVEAGIAASAGTMTYYGFNSPEVNTLSAEAARFQAGNGYKLISEQTVEVLTLASLLDRHVPPGQEIHLLSIDVEGLEEDVLRSNDWEKYRPRFILVELNDSDVPDALASPTTRFLFALQYRLVAKTFNTLAFIRGTELNRAN